jgi:hypothetical protein
LAFSNAILWFLCPIFLGLQLSNSFCISSTLKIDFMSNYLEYNDRSWNSADIQASFSTKWSFGNFREFSQYYEIIIVLYLSKYYLNLIWTDSALFHLYTSVSSLNIWDS